MGKNRFKDALSGIMMIVGFICSPALGMFITTIQITAMLRIRKFKLRHSEVINWAVFDDSMWLIIALLAYMALPWSIGIICVIWRVYKLCKVIYQREVLVCKKSEMRKSR